MAGRGKVYATDCSELAPAVYEADEAILVPRMTEPVSYTHLGRLQDREKPRDDYAALPLAVFLAFAVAGLVEWLFHPCNPLGFTTMAVLAPLLTFRGKKKKRVNENEG